MLRALSDRWFAPVLELRAVALALDASDFAHSGFAEEEEAERERFDCADIVTLVDTTAERQAFIAERMPQARFIAAPENFGAELLDSPGRLVRPRFASGA